MTPDKARFSAMARGRAMECVAAVNVIAIRGLAEPTTVAVLRVLFVRAIQMLTKLDQALSPDLSCPTSRGHVPLVFGATLKAADGEPAPKTGRNQYHRR